MKKHEFNLQSSMQEAIDHLGMTMMAASTMLAIVEFGAGHISKKPVAVLQPAFMQLQSNENPLRRERDEAGPHYISYGVAQRVPARSGRA